MSQHSFIRAVIDSLLPPGPKWMAKSDGDYDLFLDGLAGNFPEVKTFLEGLADLRNPYKTEYLSDLEKEFGVVTKTNLSNTVRREQLAAKIYERGGTGSKDDLQNALVKAGFTVQVHENSPAVDPALFLDQSFQITTGDTLNAFIGDPLAYLGRIGGELLVNGDLFDQVPKYLSELNSPNAFVGDPLATLGDFDELNRDLIVYPIPTDSDSWPFVFFVGGDATRDGSGALTAIEQAEISSEQLDEFKTIILAYKPLHSWAGLIITLT